MKKYILAIAVAALASMAIISSASAKPGNGATIKDMSNTPVSIAGQTGYNFIFWNGNGVQQNFAPTYYHGVTTPSGVHNQVLKGIVANDTGAPVTYSSNSGGPIPAGQQCWNFDTGSLSTDWSMTIEADGHYTLDCHFAKA